MKITINRRRFLTRSLCLPAAFSAGAISLPGASRSVEVHPSKTSHLKLSCNLYSFNTPLSEGTLTLEEVIDFCADLGLAAVDPTAYYFPGYPVPPKDEVLYAVKQHAFRQGLDISGTGVRNDFTNPSPNTRASSVELVKNWIETAAKLDAPCCASSPAAMNRKDIPKKKYSNGSSKRCGNVRTTARSTA